MDEEIEKASMVVQIKGVRVNRDAEAKISQAFLKECLDYNLDTGIFTWKNRPREHFKTDHGWKVFNTRFAEKMARSKNKTTEYIVICINGRLFAAHRLAWLYTNGSFPVGQIDHENGLRDDNRITNLRSVTHLENGRNQKRPKDNTSGISGVYWHKEANKWCAQIRHEGKSVHLGYFGNIFDVACARKSAENKYDYHANHGRR